MHGIGKRALLPLAIKLAFGRHVPDGRFDRAAPIDHGLGGERHTPFLPGTPNGHAVELGTAIARVHNGYVLLADAVLLGYGVYLVGKGIYTLINAIQALNTNVLNARCDPDLTAAAKALANQFVTGAGEVAGGFAGVYGVRASGGFGRIAAGLRKLTSLGKGTVPRGGVVGPDSAKPLALPKGLNGLADPSLIRFSQGSIGNTFKNGTSLQKTIDALKSGKLSPNDLPPIRVFLKDGLVYTLDNRRLLAASEAGVQVKITPATAEEIAKESWKMTTPNDGRIVCVRGICK